MGEKWNQEEGTREGLQNEDWYLKGEAANALRHKGDVDQISKLYLVKREEQSGKQEK